MRKLSLSIKIFCALVIGVLLGILLQGQEEVLDILSALGTIYTSLIKLVMVPLVFTSLTLGIANLSDLKKLGKMGGIVVVTFLITTSLAVVIGLTLSNIFHPGLGVAITSEATEMSSYPNVLDTLTGIFPSNIWSAFSEANMMQIIVISILLGIAIVKGQEKSELFKNVIDSAYQVILIITAGIMELTPLGVIGLMAPTVANNGISVLLPLIKLILVFYLGVLIHCVVIYGGLIKGLTAFSIKNFESAMFPAQMVAFTSASSAAALPVSMERTTKNLGVSKEVSGFVLPLGATINMDGNALYQGIVALFVAQAFGIDLSITAQLLVVLTGTFASIGAAGVPGAGVIVLGTVLTAAGLPIEGVALVLGIDRILDMGRTFMNITGDAVTACIVQRFTADHKVS